MSGLRELKEAIIEAWILPCLRAAIVASVAQFAFEGRPFVRVWAASFAALMFIDYAQAAWVGERGEHR